ncbi:DUF3068 domain-containing protein, partial [Streptomyces sp. SID7499]|nr:DUF3068 domain-containing protein [Streptomyces sp. SID7499]
FPFDVEKRSYRWWDGTLGGVVRLSYAGEQEVQGYSGLLFKGEVEPTKTGVRQVPGLLVGKKKIPQVLAEEWYSNSGIELVVDQRTGRIMNAAIGPRKTLRAPGSTKDAVVLLESERVEFTEETQLKQVELASADSDRLAMLGTTAPAGAAGLGGVLALAGVVLVVRGHRTEPEAPNTHMMTIPHT